MKTIDRITVIRWVLVSWVCWSTAWAASPVRWISSTWVASSAAKVLRMSATVRTAVGEVEPGGRSSVTMAWRARGSADIPWSLTPITRGRAAIADSTRVMVASSVAVRGPEGLAATRTACDVVELVNAAAR